jgi:hypothetical protein
VEFKVAHSESDGHLASPGTGLHWPGLSVVSCDGAAVVRDERNDRKDRKRLELRIMQI